MPSRNSGTFLPPHRVRGGSARCTTSKPSRPKASRGGQGLRVPYRGWPQEWQSRRVKLTDPLLAALSRPIPSGELLDHAALPV